MQNQIQKFFFKEQKKVQLNAENCIVFEDSVAGIQAANIANI